MAKVDFALIGDSHAGAIGRAARARELRFQGGPMASAKSFYSDFFEVGTKALFFTDSDVQEMHNELCRLLEIPNLEALTVPLISTIGSGFHVPATNAIWASFRNPASEFDAGFLNSDLCAAICDRMLSPMCTFHEHLIQQGITVQFVLPPQRVPETSDQQIHAMVQSRASATLADIGCTIIDVRKRTCDINGQQLPSYCEEKDPLHANIAMGEIVLAAAGY